MIDPTKLLEAAEAVRLEVRRAEATQAALERHSRAKHPEDAAAYQPRERRRRRPGTAERDAVGRVRGVAR